MTQCLVSVGAGLFIGAVAMYFFSSVGAVVLGVFAALFLLFELELYLRVQHHIDRLRQHLSIDTTEQADVQPSSCPNGKTEQSDSSAHMQRPPENTPPQSDERSFMFWEHGSSKPMVLPSYNAVFVPIPKVACTSLKTLCARLEGIKTDNDQVMMQRVHLHHLQKTPRSTRFVFVRNPWDRLVSCYVHKICTHNLDEYFANHPSETLYPFMPFAEFVEAVSQIPDHEADEHIRSQSFGITDKKGQLKVDHIGYFELLNVHLEDILGRIGAVRPHLPHLKQTPHKDYRSYYTHRTKQVVAYRYATDIALFGYTFNGIEEKNMVSLAPDKKC